MGAASHTPGASNTWCECGQSRHLSARKRRLVLVMLVTLVAEAGMQRLQGWGHLTAWSITLTM